MCSMLIKSLSLIFLAISAYYPAVLIGATVNEKVLICGVCRNVAPSVSNTIKNIEKLGKNFIDYQVIIYENNSQDATKELFTTWANRSTKIIFISETVDTLHLPSTRTERIARARNIVLSKARQLNYKDYKYLIMVDLDFKGSWPIREIVASLKKKIQWDCISANGLRTISQKDKILHDAYWDRYAFRNINYPLGPEVLGDAWWDTLRNNWFAIRRNKWLPVFSAFGGLAIYKTRSILNCSYSGVVTSDLKKYYKKILSRVPTSNSQVKAWYAHMKCSPHFKQRSITFTANTQWERLNTFTSGITCCEHVTLHASMALRGFNKFYVNPKLIIRYDAP